MFAQINPIEEQNGHLVFVEVEEAAAAGLRDVHQGEVQLRQEGGQLLPELVAQRALRPRVEGQPGHRPCHACPGVTPATDARGT